MLGRRLGSVDSVRSPVIRPDDGSVSHRPQRPEAPETGLLSRPLRLLRTAAQGEFAADPLAVVVVITAARWAESSVPHGIRVTSLV